MASCILLCLTVIVCMFETTLSQNFVSLKRKVLEHKVLFECKIDSFVHTVEFVDPNGMTVGSCVAPVPPEIEAKKPKDCGNNITQYFNNNSVILSVEKPLLGIWTCKHGSCWSNDSVNITCSDVRYCTKDEGGCDDNCISTISAIAVCMALLCLGFFVASFSAVRTKVDMVTEQFMGKKPQSKNNREMEPLLGNADVKLCVKCHQSSHILCKHCETCFCIPCLKVHEETIQHNEKNTCSSPENVKYIESFSINKDQNKKRKRVCGLVSLPENGLLIADTNFKELTWYLDCKLQKTFSLLCEPKSLIRLYESLFAISFPQQRKIQVYEFYETDLKVIKEIDLSDHGKPYTMAYSNDHFAVEIGQGDPGFIGIFKYDGVLIRSLNISAYFTGNTIRLAMDNKSERLFVSAVGKKQMLCYNTTGENKWSTEMPSARGILYFQGDSVGNETLLFANKRSDVIYKVNPNDGEREVFLYDNNNFTGPRYLAYDKTTFRLYIYGDDKVTVYEYRKYNETV